MESLLAYNSSSDEESDRTTKDEQNLKKRKVKLPGTDQGKEKSKMFVQQKAAYSHIIIGWGRFLNKEMLLGSMSVIILNQNKLPWEMIMVPLFYKELLVSHSFQWVFLTKKRNAQLLTVHWLNISIQIRVAYQAEE